MVEWNRSIWPLVDGWYAGSGLVNFKEFAQLLKELAFEVGAPIGQDLEGAAVRANDLVK